MYFYKITHYGHKNEKNKFIGSTRVDAKFYFRKYDKKNAKRNFKDLRAFLKQDTTRNIKPAFKSKRSFNSLLANFGGLAHVLGFSFLPKKITLLYSPYKQSEEEITNLLNDIEDYLLNGNWREFLQKDIESLSFADH